MLAIVCPGQGAQSPGFLNPWLELDGVRDQLEAMSDAVGIDLIAHGTTSDAETIRDTAVAQPLIVAASLVSAQALLGDATPKEIVFAGHSVGEIPASVLAGVLSRADAMRFVKVRSSAMAEASALTPSGMSAVLGGAAEDVLERLNDLGLTAANVNGGGQVVAAGALDSLSELAANPPAKARVIALQVAGAFHTEYMSPAVAQLQELAPSIEVHDPQRTLLSNFDGQAVTSGEQALHSLVAQVTRSVRWDLCMETLSAMEIDGLVELAPAGTLVGLAKRALRSVPGVAVKTPDDLDAARALLAEAH